MTGWRTLSTCDLDGASEAVSALERVGQLDRIAADTAAVLETIEAYDGYLASTVVRVDRHFLSRAPRLKLIGSPHTGTDHLDIAEIERRGVRLFHIAGERELLESFSATSELAFGLILALTRKIPAAAAAVHEGLWPRECFTGFQLLGKTLGIVGLGRLGKISARIGHGFRMRVVACDVRDVPASDVEMTDINTVFSESDIVSIHVHLNEATKGLVDARLLSMMKQDAILINTSRGAVIDEGALLEALDTGRLGGAGLDVIDGEWLSQEARATHPLVAYAREHDNLLITPHIGGATAESITGARTFMALKMADFARESLGRADVRD